MPRPKKWRIISSTPNCRYFKPLWIPLFKLDEVLLDADHYEAIRLANFEGLSMKQWAEKMWISPSTFNRILKEANRIIAEAIVFGKAIKICEKLIR